MSQSRFDDSSFVPIEKYSDPAYQFDSSSFVPIPKKEPLKANVESKAPLKTSREALDFSKIFTPKQFTKEDEEKLKEIQRAALTEGFPGIAQSMLNYPSKIINAFGGRAPQFNFAPETEAGKAGEQFGDVASFFLPGGALNVGTKALSKAPLIGNSIKAAREAFKNPWIGGAGKIGRTGGETALFEAAHHPENAQQKALEGLGIGSGIQTGLNFMQTKNPFINLLARAGAGAGIGYGIGHPGYGALALASAPEVGKFIGMGGKDSIANKLLEGLNFKDIMRAKSANDRLGTTITPAQASGNYVTSGLEGNLKRSPQGAQHAYRQERAQENQQSKAIQKMLGDIYTPTKASEANIHRLYAIAERSNLTPKVVTNLKSNPIVESAFKTVKSDPAFTNVPENNYKFLAEVDRQLFRDEQAALANKPNTAYAIGQVKSTFNKLLKNQNPYYRQATEAAQPKMVRESIEGRFNKNEEDFTGKNFYNKFLNAKKPYQQILKDTKNFPQAQEAIKDMRQGWKHLSNIKTVSQGEAQAKTGIADARDHLKVILNAMKKVSGAKQDVQGLKFIYSKDWDKQFEKIMQSTDMKKRNDQLLDFVTKVGIANGLM